MITTLLASPEFQALCQALLPLNWSLNPVQEYREKELGLLVSQGTCLSDVSRR